MTTTQTQTSNAARKVPTRRISFEESLRELPKHFASDGDIIDSHITASLSSVFPDGEDFFVRSVRHFRDQLTDPDLKRQVAGFIGQEAMHGREHRALNDRLDELGYPTKRTERWTKWGLELRTKYAPPKANLAATAALEHFTATLAELILTNEDVQELFGNEAIKNLFLWHALEESEHKAVAFDVYRAVGGSERLRTITMNMIMVGFIAGMSIQTLIGVLFDPASRNPRRLLKSVRRLRRSPLISKHVWRELRLYNKRDFHPDDRDTTELVETWRANLFGEHGTLNDLLVGSSAA